MKMKLNLNFSMRAERVPRSLLYNLSGNVHFSSSNGPVSLINMPIPNFNRPTNAGSLGV